MRKEMENLFNFPHKISDFPRDIQNKVIKEYQGQPDGFVHVGDENFVLFSGYKRCANEIYNFEVRQNDIFVCTHPRSGTTWTQEMIWLICNDFDYNTAGSEVLNKRFPYFESHLFFNDSNLKSSSLFNSANSQGLIDPIYSNMSKQSTQRFFKTHLPIKLMPCNISKVGAKIVYVARNPKDVAVSWYYLHKLHPCIAFNGDFELFVELFMDNLTVYGPHWQHVLNAWSYRNDENVFFMLYEDLILKTEETIRHLSSFLGKPINDDQLPKLLEHLKFDNFKANPSINFKVNEENTDENNDFVRRGKIGGNPEISVEMSKKFDEWIHKHLQDSEFQFPKTL